MRGNKEGNYPLFSFHMTSSRILSILTVVLVAGLGGAFYVWYSRNGSDPAPDSMVGLVYATLGTVLMLAAVLGFTLRRRSRKRAVGQLNGALNWHICFGIIALALLFMHSFGNFNPRSGTYALYGMIALVISGFVGRMLDRVMPRLIAQEVRKALTAQGEDRLEDISQKLQALMIHNTQELQGFQLTGSLVHTTGRASKMGSTEMLNMLTAPTIKSAPLQTSWDMAYISLEETPQEVERDAAQHRFVPDKKSVLARPEALIPGAQEHIAALEGVQHALRREQTFRYIIRYWRMFHVGLVLVTIGLTLWHLEYAASLWLPVLLHR